MHRSPVGLFVLFQLFAAGGALLNGAGGVRLAPMAMLSPPAVNAQTTSVCGNGVVETGEDCDPAATTSGYDECDGCAADCTLEEECGLALCEDGLDNDSDGLIDSLDPECTTLLELQSLAIAASYPTRRSVIMLRETRVAKVDGLTPGSIEPFPLGDSKAEVCGGGTELRNLATIEGSLVAISEARFRHRYASGIGEEFVATTGVLPAIRYTAPLVGPPAGTCGDLVTPCLTSLDCLDQGFGSGFPCEGRLALNDAANAFVDLDGTGEGADELARCNTAITALTALAGDVSGLGSGTAANINVAPLGNQTVNLSPGLNALHYERVRIGRRGTLTIDGPSDALLVVNVDGTLRVGKKGVIELTGGVETRNTLWHVRRGTRRGVSVTSNASLQGTILAPGRRRIRLGRGAVVQGSLYAERVKLTQRAELHHVPFTGLSPTDLSIAKSDSPDAVMAGETLTYTLTVVNNGLAWAPAATVIDTLGDGVTFVSANPSGGSCVHDGSATGGEIKCFVGWLAEENYAPANQATIEVTVTVNCETRGTVSNTATVKAQTGELDPSDNTTTPAETTVVNEDATLTISKTANTNRVEENVGLLEYTIQVQNTGTRSCARTVQIADTLPVALQGQTVAIGPSTVPSCAAHLSCTASCSAGAFPCTVSYLPPGETVTVTVTGGKIADGTAGDDCGQDEEISNTAEAQSLDSPPVAAAPVTTDVTRNQGDSCDNSCAGTTENDDCATGSCTQGFCCDAACTGTCEACSQALRDPNDTMGFADGTCGAIVDGFDTTSPGPNPGECSVAGSGNDVCDGAGSCRPVELVILTDPGVGDPEGDGASTTTLLFTVELQSGGVPAAVGHTVTVKYATADDAAENENGDGDYQSASGTLTFNPGETSKTIAVTVNGDDKAEFDESLTVGLSAATNADITGGSATGTIEDDDADGICDAIDEPLGKGPDCDEVCNTDDAAVGADCNGVCEATEDSPSADCDGVCDNVDLAPNPDCNGFCDQAGEGNSADCSGTCDLVFLPGPPFFVFDDTATSPDCDGVCTKTDPSSLEDIFDCDSVCSAGEAGSTDCDGICQDGEGAASPDCGGSCPIVTVASTKSSIECDGVCDPGDGQLPGNSAQDCDTHCEPGDTGLDCDGVCSGFDRGDSSDCDGVCDPGELVNVPDCNEVCEGAAEAGGGDCDGICDAGESAPDCDAVCDAKESPLSPDCDGNCDIGEDVSSVDCAGNCAVGNCDGVCAAGESATADCNGSCAANEGGSTDCDGLCEAGSEFSSADCNGICAPGEIVGSSDCRGQCQPDEAGSIDCDGVCNTLDASNPSECNGLCDGPLEIYSTDCTGTCEPGEAGPDCDGRCAGGDHPDGADCDESCGRGEAGSPDCDGVCDVGDDLASIDCDSVCGPGDVDCNGVCEVGETGADCDGCCNVHEGGGPDCDGVCGGCDSVPGPDCQ